MQQVGTPRDVYERPANLLVADFMGLVNKLSGTIVGRNGDRTRVQIGQQVIEARINGTPEVAGEVTVAIRPEAIALGKADLAIETNFLTGTVVESVFLGNIVEHHIDIGGRRLRVQGSRRHARPQGKPSSFRCPSPNASQCNTTFTKSGIGQ